MAKKAIIIGAGPAGLTAAYELLKRTDIKPIILEKSGDIGGISKTINYKGNRMDIGGHRFFSKSDRVMNWWFNIMPVQKTEDTYTTITYHRNQQTIILEETYIPENGNDKKVMLVRKRLSRIYFLRKFFTYPIQLSIDTLTKLGSVRTLVILASYLKAQIFKRKPEKSLEDFLINRFGRKLYLLFFKDYTEKVWGVPCNEISAEWGAQRIKGVSISKAIQHAVQTTIKKKKGNDIAQKGTETSLIEQFLYPALGPGQLWEEVARQIVEMGGEIIFHQDVKEITSYNTETSKQKTSIYAEVSEHEKADLNVSSNEHSDKESITDSHIHNEINAVTTINTLSGEVSFYEGDYFFSTMPVQELIAGMNGEVPQDVKENAAGLQYRDFITIGVLLNKLTYPDNKNNSKILPDTWIYIQEKDVKVGRLQIFNNWSPFMVKDPDTVWIGMEYFCNTTDEFWKLSNEDIQRQAIEELEKMGLAKVEDVLDSTVQRVEKTYPAYFGTYNQFDKIRNFTDQFENLFLIGRNGMHKYNNSDHSMLTAMASVDNICEGITSKDNIWSINTEQEYHEKKQKVRNQTLEVGSQNHNETNYEKSTSHKNSGIKESIINGHKTTHTQSEHTLTFKDFLFNTQINQRFVWLAGIAMLLQFAVFKYFYPYPSFIHDDSFVYLKMASQNTDIGTYPIGYSRFLRIFSALTSSDIALVTFQYISIQSSALLLLFTLFYFNSPSKLIQITLWVFVVFNPLSWYFSNLVSSDAIFLALSLIWFTLLLWIMYKPTKKLILWHALVLFILFTVRYNAIYYPIISCLSFLLSKERLSLKYIGLGVSFTLVIGFIGFTTIQYNKLIGVNTFSPFSGWQVLNNAMYAYRYVDSTDRKPVPNKFQIIDRIITAHLDSSKHILIHPVEQQDAKTYYMWAPWSPLQIYMNQQFKDDSSTSKFKKWASVGPLYADYGGWLIKQYPLNFAKHYLLPNILNYYTPPTEFLSTYNMGRDSIALIAQNWFGYKDNKVKSAFKDLNVNVVNIFPIMAGVANIIFICSFVCYIYLRKHKRNRQLDRATFASGTLWLLNFGFSVFASPIALRFQIFPMLVILFISALLLEYIFKIAYMPKTERLQRQFRFLSALGR